jgi:hypothetical protein
MGGKMVTGDYGGDRVNSEREKCCKKQDQKKVPILSLVGHGEEDGLEIGAGMDLEDAWLVFFVYPSALE